MVREILIPTEPSIFLSLPPEFVGKRIEVLAFEVGEEAIPPPAAARLMPSREDDPDFEARLARIRAIAAKTPLDLRNFKFDRDEANNYDDDE